MEKVKLRRSFLKLVEANYTADQLYDFYESIGLWYEFTNMLEEYNEFGGVVFDVKTAEMEMME